jgi:hypothetical protein
MATWTQTDLDAINKAISTGAKRVRFQTHEVEYQTVEEMLRIRDSILADLGQSQSGGMMFAEFGGGY